MTLSTLSGFVRVSPLTITVWAVRGVLCADG